MSTFPLYENLKNDKKDVQVNKADFIKKFKKIDSKSHSLIYALIKSYQIDNKINILSSSLPFNGTKLKTKNRLKFNLIDLPDNLQKILYKFILLDLKKNEKNKDG
jgi:hypothetical protein